MANPHKGEVALKSNGKVYTLLFDINTICEIEQALDASISELGDVLSEGAKLSTIRVMIWAGLQHHHPGLSLQDAGHVIAGSDMKEMSQALGQGLASAFPKPEGGASKPDPRAAPAPKKGRGGTGKHS